MQEKADTLLHMSLATDCSPSMKGELPEGCRRHHPAELPAELLAELLVELPIAPTVGLSKNAATQKLSVAVQQYFNTSEKIDAYHTHTFRGFSPITSRYQVSHILVPRNMYFTRFSR